MPIVSIDGTQFDSDTLSPEGQQNLQMLNLADMEIKRLQVQLAIAQTAKMAYAKKVLSCVPSSLDQALSSDTLKLG